MACSETGHAPLLPSNRPHEMLQKEIVLDPGLLDVAFRVTM